MSKTTKIIAIVGGVLILVFLIFAAVTPGGLSGTFEVIGCGGGKKAPPPRFCERPENKDKPQCKKPPASAAAAQEAKEEKEEEARPAARPAARPEARPAAKDEDDDE